MSEVNQVPEGRIRHAFQIVHLLFDGTAEHPFSVRNSGELTADEAHAHIESELDQAAAGDEAAPVTLDAAGETEPDPAQSSTSDSEADAPASTSTDTASPDASQPEAE